MKSKIEWRKIFGPTSLSSGEKLGRGEIFQILVTSEDIDQMGRSFNIMMPDAEWFKDSEEFLIMVVIIEFGGMKSA
jgi:hypothetical protein